MSRISRLIKHYEDRSSVDITPYLGSVGTLFVIVVSTHMMTCIISVKSIMHIETAVCLQNY